MIFSYFWHELRRGLLELRRVLNLSSAGIDSSSAGFDSSSAGLLDYGTAGAKILSYLCCKHNFEAKINVFKDFIALAQSLNDVTR